MDNQTQENEKKVVKTISINNQIAFVIGVAVVSTIIGSYNRQAIIKNNNELMKAIKNNKEKIVYVYENTK